MKKKKPTKKKAPLKKRVQNKVSKIEKQFEREFEKLLEQDEIKRRLANYSNRRYRNKIKYQKAVADKKTGLQISALKNIQDINKAEEEFRIKKKITKRDKEEKRAKLFFEKYRAGEIDLPIPYNYYHRKEIMDFVFNNSELNYFLNMNIKKNADKIVSKIDKLLQELESTELLIIIVSKDKVTEYYIVNSKEYDKKMNETAAKKSVSIFRGVKKNK